MNNQLHSSTPQNGPQNRHASGANPLLIIALAFIGLIGGGIGGIAIEVAIGLITRNIGGLFYLHVALAALPYLGAIIGAIALPLIYTRTQGSRSHEE